MSNSNQTHHPVEYASVVFIPVRYGQILGVYASQEDAMQIVSSSIYKGQPCDLVVRSIVQSSNLKSNAN